MPRVVARAARGISTLRAHQSIQPFDSVVSFGAVNPGSRPHVSQSTTAPGTVSNAEGAPPRIPAANVQRQRSVNAAQRDDCGAARLGLLLQLDRNHSDADSNAGASNPLGINRSTSARTGARIESISGLASGRILAFRTQFRRKSDDVPVALQRMMNGWFPFKNSIAGSR